MSHLLKEYSKNLGVEPKKPTVNRHFFPICTDKYIVVYNEQDIQSKTYYYYQIVFNLIRTVLKDKGYSIIVIGSGKNLVDGADHYCTDLSFRKYCYIVSKASAFISIDNALTQYAGSIGVPVVNLYGNIYPSITTAYWSNKKNKIDLEPDWDKKPCLSLFDPKESINKINPEDVALSILKLLDYPKEMKMGFKTKRKNKAKHFQVDIVPTNYVNSNMFNGRILNLRLDLGEVNEQALFSYCANHTCNLITKDFLVDLKALQRVGHNIKRIIFKATSMPEKIPDLYFEYLKKLDIDFMFLVFNKNILDDIRLEYFDQEVELLEVDREKPSDISLDDKFISYKAVIEGDKAYKSTAHWKKKIDSDNNILDNLSYWEELDYFYIYEQEEDSDKNNGKESGKKVNEEAATQEAVRS